MMTEPDITCISLEQLARQAADLSEFERRLARNSDLVKIDALYVQPNYQVQAGAGSMGKNLDEYVLKWLNSGADCLLWLLGDFGTGKTWFSTHFAHKLAEMKVDDTTRAPPTPVVVLLRQYTHTTDMFQAVQEVLDKGGAHLAAGRDTVEWLIAQRKLVPVFDGADEHATALRDAHQLAARGCHVIVTCRTHYFDSVSKMLPTLGVDDAQTPVAWITHLGFNEDSLVEAIRRRCPRDWQQKQAALTRRPDLWELVHRPLFLDMVLQALDETTSRKAQTVADVYKGHVDQVLHTRWQEHPQGSIMTGVLPRALKRLARMGQETSPRMIKFSRDVLLQVAQEVRQNDDATVANVEIEDIREAMCTGSVLVRNPQDNYEFGHLSIQEYFAATAFVDLGADGESLVCAHVADDDWREVCWLYASAGGNVASLLDACLAAGSPDHPKPLFLAARAHEAAKQSDDDGLSKLGDALIALFMNEQPAYHDLQQIYDSIRRMGKAGRNTLRRHIRSKDPRIRRRCVLTWFESFGHEAFEEVLPYLDPEQEESRHVRWHVAEVLAEVAQEVTNQEALERFLAYGENPDPIIRGNALWARTTSNKVSSTTHDAIERIVDELNLLVAGDFGQVADELKPFVENDEQSHHPRAHGALLLGRCVAALPWDDEKKRPVGDMLSTLLRPESDWSGYVARGLGELGWIGAVPPLCHYLATSQDDEIWMRYAVDAVENLAQPEQDHISAIEKARDGVPAEYPSLRPRLEALAARLKVLSSQEPAR
jgi:hypothetical protein